MILEELTRDDKTEIRDMISKEIQTTLKSRDTKDIIEKASKVDLCILGGYDKIL